MRIAIVGSGALGGYYGALMAHHGYDVRFLMRSDYQVVKAQGLTVRSCRGDFHLDQVDCYRRPEEIGLVDLVFIGLKTTADFRFRELLTPLMGPDSLALTVQNGLGNDDKLAKIFGPRRIAGGLAFLCANRIAPGVIKHLDYGHMHIGNYQQPPDDRLHQISQIMLNSGIDCKVVANLLLAQWRKLVWNVPFNGLSALLDMTVDQIIADDKLVDRAASLMKEVQAAAQTQGLMIHDDDLEQMLAYTYKMEPYYTSMHLDRRNGHPLEIESIIGEPLRRGQNQGVEMPAMARLYQGLKAIETGGQV